MFRKLMFVLIFIIFIPFSLFGQESVATFVVFPGDAGKNPKDAGLVIIDDYIYGTTLYGGTNDAGTIYRVKTDGMEYEVLHHFDGSTVSIPNGYPRGTLTYDGEKIFGNCQYFSGNSGGIVFSINADGTGFRILADFYDGSGAFVNGKFPGYGGVTIADGVLYGSTSLGGANDRGSIFSLNKDGSNFKVIYNFSTGLVTGHGCYSGVRYKNGYLYGATISGGQYSSGTIFRIRPDGSGFTVLRHLFSSDGATPYAPLLLDGDTIYGLCFEGGVSNNGAVLSINIDGSGYKILHTFSDSDGKDPGVFGGLTLLGPYLYGATKTGGGDNEGTLFRIKTDGSGFEVLSEFTLAGLSNYKGTLIYDAPYLIGSAYADTDTGNGALFRYYIGYLR